MKTILVFASSLLLLAGTQANAQCCKPTNKKTGTETINQKTGETVKLKIKE